MAEDQPYIYAPLDQSEPTIRLVKLDYDIHDKIVLSLEHMTLKDAEDRYTAISYTWVLKILYTKSGSMENIFYSVTIFTNFSSTVKSC